MNDLFILGLCLLNMLTAVIFFRLGAGMGLPKFTIPKLRGKENNFTNEDLLDIRDVPANTILDSLKKNPPKREKTVEEDFQEVIN